MTNRGTLVVNRGAKRRLSRCGQVLALGVLAMAGLSCGASTGLWVPCEIELRPSTPQVVVVVDHSAASDDVYQFVDNPPGSVPGSRIGYSVFGPMVAALSRALPTLDEDPSTPAAVGLYVFPDLGPGPVAQNDVGRCSTPPDMLLPVTAHGSAVVINQLHQWDDGSGNYWYNHQLSFTRGAGGAPVGAALQIARRALDRVPTPGPHFIVLETVLGADCNLGLRPEDCDCNGSPIQACLSHGVYACNDSTHVVSAIDSMRLAGIRTLVLSGGGNVTGPAQPGDESYRVAVARAGGLARPGGRPYYLWNEPEAFTAAVREQIAPAGWCEPRAIGPVSDPDQRALRLAARGFVRRDRTHTDGWDWVDTTAGTLRLYGPSCDAAMQARGGLLLSLTSQECLE